MLLKLKKERKGKKGRPRWPLYMYNLIMKMLVNSTPPFTVNDNILAHVTKFSPTTTIKELPSIWTIQRTHTVGLIIVEVLAACRLGKSNKWQQLFTDTTTRRQTAFTNFAISIPEEKDDDIYTSLLLSCSIYSPNGTSEAVVMAIIKSLKDKGNLLEKWRECHSAMFGLTDNHDFSSGWQYADVETSRRRSCYHGYMFTSKKSQSFVVGWNQTILEERGEVLNEVTILT